MSLENVKAFYQRLAQDEQFRSELSKVKSKAECSQLVQQAGYNFTQEEFENYTSELLESSFNQGELNNVNEKELEAVFGGAIKPYIPPELWPIKLPAYGIPPMPMDILEY
ncbi:MAG: Nif11-like leader peptide family natural product precursor [Crocosphaera sp.]|nr:Nif11-like leader peptide family natural product precursor [Crocosphaera sp.]